jgi:hypothetical protein
MKESIKTFVAACSVCQQAKAGHVPYPGLLQPLAIPDQAWQVVTMDFIEGNTIFQLVQLHPCSS